MSDWLLATREVYAAGGELDPRRCTQPHDAYYRARQHGFLERGTQGGKLKPLRITQRGIDLVEGRLTMKTPYVPAKKAGRAHGTHRRLVATWLAALPRPNEIRLQGA